MGYMPGVWSISAVARLRWSFALLAVRPKIPQRWGNFRKKTSFPRRRLRVYVGLVFVKFAPHLLSVSVVSRLRWSFVRYWRCVLKFPKIGKIFVKKNGPRKLPPGEKLAPKKKKKKS